MLSEATKDSKRKAAFGKERICAAIDGRFCYFRLWVSYVVCKLSDIWLQKCKLEVFP